MLKFSEILSEIKTIDPRHFNNPPEGWTEDKDLKTYNDDEGEIFGGEVVKVYSAPMEGWDENHSDDIYVIHLKNDKFRVDQAYAFGDWVNGDEEYDTLAHAILFAFDLMKEISEDWTDEYNDLEEISTTGGGIKGASFTAGAGEQYATPFAFKRTKKKYKKLRENLEYGDDLAGQIIKDSIKRFQEIESIIQKTKNKLLATNIGEILEDPQQLRLLQEGLEKLEELNDKTKTKIDDIADTLTDRDKPDWDSYNKVSKISDIGSDLNTKITATQFIVNSLLDIYDKLAEDKDYLFKAFNKI